MKLTVFYFTADKTIPPPTINPHYEWKVLGYEDVPTFASLSKLIRQYHPVVFCTTGDSKTWKPLWELPYQYRCKWIHHNSPETIKTEYVENCYIRTLLPKEENNTRNPMFSVITTTFHSGKKLMRPFQSLSSQTYRNWEWIVWDDSKEGHDAEWNQLKMLEENDIRIKVYRDTHPSGYIGHMKWLSSSLSKGDWLVELDHDDIIHPKLLEWCAAAICENPDADFLCSSCVELFEDTEKPFNYGDYFAFGYGCYQKQWIRNKWHNVAPVVDLNPTTIRHIIGVPNHVRIWRRSFYEKIGRHNSDLPVVDDYELLIRSMLQGKWVRIHAPGYFQYKNTGGNNFTNHRNRLIQYLSARTFGLYKTQIDERWKELEFAPTITQGKAWEITEAYDKKFMKTFVPKCDVKKTISVLIPIEKEVSKDELMITLNSLDANCWVYLIGDDRFDGLEKVMDEIRQVVSFSVLDRIHWWKLDGKKDLQIIFNYFHRMLWVTDQAINLRPGSVLLEDYLQHGLQNDKNAFEKVYKK